ncbi:MAG: hypothetical protein O3A63_18225 [Proteobacteria bacterium]|nr:hypothetical protein [Pseudomonadota bacterium]
MRTFVCVAVLLFAMWAQAAEPGPQSSAFANSLVFGSFSIRANAEAEAARLKARFLHDVHVYPIDTSQGTRYRVATGILGPADMQTVSRSAQSQGIAFWRQYVSGLEGQMKLSNEASAQPLADRDSASANEHGAAADPSSSTAVVSSKLVATIPTVPQSSPSTAATRQKNADFIQSTLDFDVGLQTRGYAQKGADGQDQLDLSASGRLKYHREWDDGLRSVTITPFFRYDQSDSERTHFDIRELFWSGVGDEWEFHVGARQIFWGVTEFNHLVDIINQTDLVENIDGEDKLGQPMVQVSLTRDFGLLEFFLLTGFRERTFPGPDGRLRLPVPIDTDRPIYESAAGNKRVDAAARWSKTFGPTEVGVYHFSGTNRDPQFVPEIQPGGELVLRPMYNVIDQTGVEALTILGDWALKLEMITRSGDGDRYEAFTTGFERTFVGLFGGRSDVGLVLEYMFDERGELATNTPLENDVAFGTRLRLNDVDDSQALFGLIWDVETQEYMLSLEASRRLGNTWTLFLEGRAFSGADEVDPNDYFNAQNKSGFLQRDDFIQLELTRYF